MFFIGIDLAWSPKNQTGIAVLEGDKKRASLKHVSCVQTDEEILAVVKQYAALAPAFVAIDAPLIVSNKTGRRLAEALVAKQFAKYHAGAHPSNRTRFAAWGGPRGETVSKLLEKAGFSHKPNARKHELSNVFFEVYPHPAMIVLFGLQTVIPYKAKPKRDYLLRWNAFEHYQQHMKKLEHKKPSLHIGSFLDARVRNLKGKALKNYEDQLDGIFCAYLAYYAWQFPEKCVVLGNMKQGYILTPALHNATV